LSWSEGPTEFEVYRLTTERIYSISTIGDAVHIGSIRDNEKARIIVVGALYRRM